MTGDGELQEGQIWESLQTAAHQQINNVSVIVDCKKFRQDAVLLGYGSVMLNEAFGSRMGINR